jgi:tRNA (guanine10-N2)-dimethyltransferase
MFENLEINSINTNRYIYVLNYTDQLKNLCDLEMKSIFGFIPTGKFFFSATKISSSRSIFIKSRMDITHIGNSLEDLVQSIEGDSLFYNDYKISYIKSNDNTIDYQERLKALRLIGFAIEGNFALQNPKIEFAVTKVNDQWMFGQYIINDHTWINHKQKPYNYSYALDHQLARSLVNLAIGNNPHIKVVDPCCGIGTIIIEGRELGINIKGYDINPNVVEKCNKNLQHFGFEDDIVHKSIQDITEPYDVAIVDLPYGKFSTTTLEEQRLIINKAKEIAHKVIFVSMVNLDSLLTSHGFEIIEGCFIKKRDKFSRYITICC